LVFTGPEVLEPDAVLPEPELPEVDPDFDEPPAPPAAAAPPAGTAAFAPPDPPPVASVSLPDALFEDSLLFTDEDEDSVVEPAVSLLDEHPAHAPATANIRNRARHFDGTR
jgi:hypothetical protein